MKRKQIKYDDDCGMIDHATVNDELKNMFDDKIQWKRHVNIKPVNVCKFIFATNDLPRIEMKNKQ